MKKPNDEFIIKQIIIVIIAAVALCGAYMVIKKVASPNREITMTDVTPQNKAEGIHDYDKPATIEPKELPEDLEATIGFTPNQLQKLTEHFVLSSYEIGQESIVYYYQTSVETYGERFMVICTKMSENDYLSSIPDKNITKENYKGLEITYSKRHLYSVRNDFVLEKDGPIQEGIDNGTMEIEYGNSLNEVIIKDCFYWYDNGIKYEIQVRNQKIPYEDLLEIAKKIIDVGK